LSAFEFFFTLYGLVMGLSVVEIVSGFARLAHDRRHVMVGLLTPTLAVFMLLDLARFWVSAYDRLQSYDLSYAVLVISIAISCIYYVAASVVFPRDFKAEPDFDAVFMRHRRLVMGAMIVTGVLAFDMLPLFSEAGRVAVLAKWTDPAQFWSPVLFILAALAVMVAKDRRLILVLLVLLILPNLRDFVTSLPGMTA
jgi:hypothetical protein